MVKIDVFDQLVDQNDNYVMDLHGQVQQDRDQNLIGIFAMILIAGLVVMNRRKKDYMEGENETL